MKSNDDWVKIYTTSQEHLAALLQSMLEEHDIPCTMLNKKDTAYGFGDIELYTLKDHALRASHLIQKSAS